MIFVAAIGLDLERFDESGKGIEKFAYLPFDEDVRGKKTRAGEVDDADKQFCGQPLEISETRNGLERNDCGSVPRQRGNLGDDEKAEIRGSVALNH